VEYHKETKRKVKGAELRFDVKLGRARIIGTVDRLEVEADGSLTLLGRGSQVINSAGEKIFPEEVEEAVKRVDGVLDCLVVGIDNDKFGQAVTAVVSLSAGATVEEAAIIASVKTQLARYKAPKRVVFVSQIPRAPNGKPDYKTARDLAIAGL
jgi:fatty-acyl-CoA synthase